MMTVDLLNVEIQRLARRIEVLEKQAESRNESNWVGSKDLAKFIPQIANQSEASRIQFLRSLRDRGIIHEGVHWVNRGKGRRPIYMYRPDLVKESINLMYESGGMLAG